jgi:hypothetical protein
VVVSLRVLHCILRSLLCLQDMQKLHTCRFVSLQKSLYAESGHVVSCRAAPSSTMARRQ